MGQDRKETIDELKKLLTESSNINPTVEDYQAIIDDEKLKKIINNEKETKNRTILLKKQAKSKGHIIFNWVAIFLSLFSLIAGIITVIILFAT